MLSFKILKSNKYFSNIKIPISKKVALYKKRNTQLINLKKQLAKKQPINTRENLYKQYHHKQIYQKIDTNIQIFFHQRNYNLDNFNFLINLLVEQNKIQQIDLVLQKMKILKIQLNNQTYNYLIKAATKMGNIKLAEEYFKQAVQKFLPNKYLYTTLMQCYVINNDPYQAQKILNEMTQVGLVPDLPTYATLINSFLKGRKLQKCWQINKKVINSELQLDQTYVGVMLKVYAATHDSQKAIKLYRQNILAKNIKPMIETTNSYFKALAGRKQYAQKVIDTFMIMAENGEIINNQTAKWALKGCATLGNIRCAGQILKLMKRRELAVDKSIYSIILRVYSKACQTAHLEQERRQIILLDSWKLIEQVSKSQMLDTIVLNNLLSVYASSLRQAEIEGLILPLYEKNGIQLNVYTYEILMKMYFKVGKHETVMRIWNQLKEYNNNKIQQYQDQFGSRKAIINKNDQDFRPTFQCLDIFLQVGIKMMDMKQVLDALKMFKELKRMPKNQTLKFLGNLQNVPQQIIASLMDFRIRFGKAKKDKSQQNNIEDPQNL